MHGTPGRYGAQTMSDPAQSRPGARTAEARRNRVALLDPDHANPDMVDEMTRKELNVVRPDEVVVPLK